MFNAPLGRRIVPVLLLGLLLPPAARGDGCVIDRLGRYVPEKEQVAFIEWQDGQERLYVATRTAPTEHASLWIVPVRARPDHVQAEPVESAPQVVYYQRIVARARERLEQAVFMTGMLDTGMFPCALLSFIGCSADKAPNAADVQEHQRVERFGMVVTVVTAKSAEGLDRYLSANGVNTSAARLIALMPYLDGQDEYSLICGWLAKGGQELTARAVRVDFPTPQIFYPLQPTRVYDSEIPTVVYVRGLVRPVASLPVPGVQCGYLRGAVEVTNLGSGFEKFKGPLKRGRRPPSDEALELLTRVELTSRPSSWTSDLVLEPGAPAAIEVAWLIDRGGLPLLWGWSIVLGILLSVFLPWAIISRENRSRTDCLWAAVVGAATGLSIWVSILLFLAWNRQRFPGPTHGRVATILGRTIPVLGVFGIVAFSILVTANLLGASGTELFVITGMIGVLLLAACFPLGLIYFLERLGNWARAAWFVLFMLTHGGLACLLFFGLWKWLSTYE
jgi:hypothetical protein